jgi:D-amino-acid dehydrogenase
MPGLFPQLPKLLFGPHRPLAVRAGYWPRMVPWGLRFLRMGSEAKVRQTVSAMEVLCAPSIDLYRRHLAGTGHAHLIRDSLYVHAFRDAGRANLDAIDYRIRREKGADLELVGADRLHEIEPALSRDFGAAVLIKGQARALSPGGIGSVLADKAMKLGVRFRKTEVISLRQIGAAWIIECSEGPVRADRVVVSMGAWSARVLAPLGISLPLAAERGYHVEFPEPGIELNNSVMDMDGKFVASSMDSGLRVAGHAEFGAVDAPPDPRREALLLRQAKAAFPDLGSQKPRFWMGRRPSFPDSLPAIGAFKGFRGLYAGFGHSHYGLMMAPKTGEVLADILTDRKPNADLSAFETGRFTRS